MAVVSGQEFAGDGGASGGQGDGLSGGTRLALGQVEQVECLHKLWWIQSQMTTAWLGQWAGGDGDLMW